jgi:hypothetical protein
MATQPTATAATKTNPYPYAGKGAGYQDPLAQELYKKYTPGMNTKGGPEAFNTLMELSKGYAGTSTNYIDPLNPGNWGAGPMKNEYLQRGGLGTYEQQAQYPGATNWPMDASGNPLPRLNMQTGQAESIVPGAPAPGAGSGSTNSLSPDILKKMWR